MVLLYHREGAYDTMKLKLTKKGLRLYVTKTKYLKLDRIILLILALIIILNLVTDLISMFTYDETMLQVKAFSFTTEEVLNEEVEETQQEVLVTDSISDGETAENKEAETVIQEEHQESNVLNYRMTYYYTGDGTDSGSVTASGKSTDMFQVNEHGWYTYEGKLVVATASKRLLSWEKYKDSTQVMYDLYDELTIIINNVSYDAIVLDVCGAAMREPRIDLFVSGPEYGIDTDIQVIKK